MSEPTVIVFGNEKGGTGKSTTAVQVAVGLMKLGHAVATLDLDARQGSLSRYIENRAERGDLAMPAHEAIEPSVLAHATWAAEADQDAFDKALRKFADRDFVVVDTPGNDTRLSRLAHARADVLVTPINDSFLDLDLLARLDPDTHEFVRCSVYAESVVAFDRARAAAGKSPIDWIVMRNRLGHGEARNKREMSEALKRLSEVLCFRLAKGFGERVIFRELFMYGLTVFDLSGPSLSMSHIAARQEARGLIESILTGPAALKAAREDKAA